jgi:transcription elongation factor GreA
MITKLGKEKLEAEIAELKEELNRTFEERNKAAAEGDLSENSAYIFYGERALVLSTQIDQAISDLKESVVQKAPIQTEVVTFGHKVKIFFENDQREMVVTLVGKNDARLKPDWISDESPLGIALLNKHKLDKILVNEQPVTILEISIGGI